MLSASTFAMFCTPFSPEGNLLLAISLSRCVVVGSAITTHAQAE